MLQKLNTHHKLSKLFLSPVNSASALFGIRHFAGTVYYSAKGKEDITVRSTVNLRFSTPPPIVSKRPFKKAPLLSAEI